MGEPYLLAYLAGCMDSDGYFTIRRDLRAMRAGARSPSHCGHTWTTDWSD